jgi:plasmid stabilization system protein ParE
VIRYTFIPIAAADLEGIWDFIAEDNVTAADRVINDLHSAVEALADMPGRTLGAMHTRLQEPR